VVLLLSWNQLSKDEFGEVVRSGIYTYGETVYFVERKKITTDFLARLQEWKSDYKNMS
jgi:4-hydroxyphenylpyruvate dioxygenase